MSKFLNTQSFYEELLNLINNCKKELVIIVPYIKMTDEIFECLRNANERGVETTLVYREEKVNQQELDKLHSLDNINLLHHPNVHCKCYFNGDTAIIGSLNLYDYSIANNREMGVLIGSHPDSTIMSGRITEDFLIEIQSIFNSSHIVKKSKDTISNGFNINIVKTSQEHCQVLCDKLSVEFLNKKFKPSQENPFYNTPLSENYFDHVDVYYDSWRAIFIFKDLERSKKFYKGKGFTDFSHADMGVYNIIWHDPENPFYLYFNYDNPEGRKLKQETDFSITSVAWQRGIEKVIKMYREANKI